MYEVKVVDRWDTREKWVYIFRRDLRDTYLLRIVQEEQGQQKYRNIYVPDGQMIELDPTFKLDDEWIEQLVVQLSGHKPDDDTVREAYLHERNRVDRLIEYATQAQVQLWDSSTQGRP